LYDPNSPPADLTPVITCTPSSFVGTSNFTTVVDINEIASNDTKGLITVYVSKDPKVTITYTGSATISGLIPVQNSEWTFDGASNPNYYIFTKSSTLFADDVSSFGFDCVINPAAQRGAITMTTIIVAGSGGDTILPNNHDGQTIIYEIQ
jgi:hypothetical protein